MKLICLLLIFVISNVSQAKDIESNDISASTPPIHLDTTLRKALLRALTELENEDDEKRRRDEENSTNNYSTTFNPNDERIVERASASAVSFYTNEEVQQTTTEKQETTERPVVIIQRSSGVSHKPIISVLNSEDANEEFITSASSNFKSGGNNIIANVNTLGDFNDKSITAGVKSPVVKNTTPIPQPTTEENQAKVEDVQFFSAPLVAAFTVHQDERGLPKKVEPIYKSEHQDKQNNKSGIQEQILQLEQQKKQHDDLVRQKQFLEQQVQRQKLLINEQQHQFQQERHLQNQQFQQQQQFQQKYLIQEQKKIIEEQQKKQLQQLNNQPFIPVINPINRFKENTFVSLQPSISVSSAELSAGILPLNAQILPIKNHANFHQSPPTSLNQYTPLHHNFNNFQTFPNNFVQSLPDVRQSTRVFRQEFGTGNFGFNNNNNRLQPQPTIQNHNRFFRSNLESSQPQHFNQQLNNLLLNSGIARNVRQNEDLNLVSKVLSYNVGRDQFYRPIRF